MGIIVTTTYLIWDISTFIKFSYILYRQHARMGPESRSSFLIHLPLEQMAAILADNNLKCIFLNENYRIQI